MQVRAVEEWLDEGWSLWRIGYGLANLIAMAVTVYVYAREPRHPGAVWRLLAAVAIMALSALGEMLRWRIKHCLKVGNGKLRLVNSFKSRVRRVGIQRALD